MNAEKLIKASRAHANERKQDGEGKRLMQHSFYKGACWQAVQGWHPCTDKPEEGKLVLAVASVNSAHICGPNHCNWEHTVKHFHIRAWIYVKDITPRFELIMGDNEEILKRLNE